jgi:hypothetical protein
MREIAFSSSSSSITSARKSSSASASSTPSTSSLFVATERPPLGIPGTAKLDKDWKDLGFEFRPTKSNLRITFKNGQWGEMELCQVSTDTTNNIH